VESLPLPPGAATEATLSTRLADSTFTGRFPAAAPLGDAVANPSLTSTASYLFGYNGTTWDRLRSSIGNGLLVDVSRITASLPPGTNYIGRTRLTDGALDLSLLNTAPNSDTGQVAVPVRVISSLAGGAGGTSSSYGAAFPSTGTAAGFSDGLNMQGARVYDTDTGAGTQYTLGVNLRVGASGGSVEAATGAGATSASTLRVVLPTDQSAIPVTQSGAWAATVTQSTASNLRAQTASESTVNAALPTMASAAGFSDGANLQVPRLVDVDSSSGTQWMVGSAVVGPGNGAPVVADVESTTPGASATGLYVWKINKKVGNPVTTSVTCTTSATAAPASPLANRVTGTFVNNSNVTIYLGGSSVTTATGIPLLPGASFTDDIGHATYYCIVASGTADLRVLEN
jgi:hypothetical protein